MTKVFLSPSDQDNNPVLGGGNEQQYAQARCARAAEILRAHGIEVKVSQAGVGDDSGGFLASIAEGNAWGPDLYVADHTNAGSGRNSGVQAYCYMPDPQSVRLGRCINARMDPIVPGGASIQDGGHLGEVNGSHATAVLMESGYHDNAADAPVIRSKTREMGEALAYGILDHLGITINTSGGETTAETPTPKGEDVSFIISNSERGQGYVSGGIYRPIPTPEFSTVLDECVPDCQVVPVNARQYDIIRAMHQPVGIDLSQVLTAIANIGSEVDISDDAVRQIVDAVSKIQAQDVAGQLEVGVKA